MRFIVLLALVLFFPVFAHAAPPTLEIYTISNSTIYPGATAESGFATTTTVDIKFSEEVKASIKILSANGTKVRLLYPSSGSSSSLVTDPKPKIWDGTDDSGAFVSNGTYTILISATSTTSLTMTESKTIVVASSGGSDSSGSDSDSTDTTTTTTTPAASSSGGAPPEYIPIPTLRIIAGGNRTVSSGADTAFTAAVYDGKGNKRDDAFILWSFGDGMQRTGASVYHAYYNPGEYAVVVHVTTPDGGDALVESILTVKDASIKIASVSARGISLTNGSSRTLDLSLWRLSSGGKEFKIPTGTQILAGRTILFPLQIIQLPLSNTASLLYPSGEVSALYPPALLAPTLSADRQPSIPQTSFNKVQAVRSTISNTVANIQTYEKAVIAPTAATELAAVGAAVSTTPPVDAPKAGGVFRSPWFMGLIGVIVLAGGAFMFL